MVKKRTIAIIQSRLGSLRLPNKALIKLGSKTILTFLIDRLSKSKFINDIIIAIPKNKKNIELKNYIKKKNINFMKVANTMFWIDFLGLLKNFKEII